MPTLKYNAHVFDEIKYVAPSAKHTLNPNLSDLEFIKRVVQFRYFKKHNESEDDYTERIVDELNSYPLIGIVPKNSRIANLIYQWVAAGHYTSLFDRIDYANGAPSTTHKLPYFLTNETNYDVIDVDLLGGNDDGTKKKQFLDFVNTKQAN